MRSSILIFSFFILLFLIPGILVKNGIAQAQGTHNHFIVGLLGVPSTAGTRYLSHPYSCFSELKDAGFNVVQSYWQFSYNDNTKEGLIPGSKYYVGLYLDEASKDNLKVLVTFPHHYGRIRDRNNDLSLDFYQRDPQSTGTGDTLITILKHNKALYGYLLADEPQDIRNNYSGFISSNNLKKAYDHYRTLDPDHPFLITLNDYDYYSNSHTWTWNKPYNISIPKFNKSIKANYNGTSDIILNDTYIVGNPTRWTDKLHEYDDLISSFPRVHAVLNIEWHQFKMEEASTFLENDKQLLEYEAFTSIIHGVSGIWFFSFNNTFPWVDSAHQRRKINPDTVSPYFKNQVLPVVSDIDKIKNEYLGSTTVGSYYWGKGRGVYASVNDNDLQYIIKRSNTDTSYVLILANCSSRVVSNAEIFLNTFKPSTSAARLKNSTDIIMLVHADGNASKPVLANGVLTDILYPWEIRIYKLSQPKN